MRNSEWHIQIFMNISVFKGLFFSVTLYFIWGAQTSHTGTKRWCYTQCILNCHTWKPNFTDIAIAMLSLFTSHESAVETLLNYFQYNTKCRRLSNYSIKLILCSHYRSSYKGLCQNKQHGFGQYTKGCHFCTAHNPIGLKRDTGVGPRA